MDVASCFSTLNTLKSDLSLDGFDDQLIRIIKFSLELMELTA